MRYLYKKRFLQAYDRLSPNDQELVRTADRQIRDYHRSRNAPYGLRIKKLHQKSGGALYEARPTLALRVVWAERDDMASFLLLGTHDEVRRFLKSLVS